MTAFLRQKAGMPSALWALAACTLCFGYGAVEVHYRAALTAAQDRIAFLYRRIGMDERIIRASADAGAAQYQIDLDIRRRAFAPSEAVELANVLAIVARTGSGAHVQVLSIEPNAAAPPAAPPSPLFLRPVIIRVEGRFRDLLAFLIALPQKTTALAIDRTDLSAAMNAKTEKPLVDATIQATIYELRRDMEVPHAAEPR
jgi:hypothetical protein